MLNKTIKTFLPVFWMGIIFVLSNIPYEYYPIQTTNAQQTLAHIFLYAVLSFLIIFGANSWKKKWQVENIILFSIFFSIFYAITDEYHQGFVPGRFVSYEDLIFDGVGAVLGAFFGILTLKKKPKLLLHICCIGCGAYIGELLKKDYNLILYFFNPNIFPKEEYDKRFEETKRIAKKLGLKLIAGEYNHEKWLQAVTGLEKEAEGGGRCLVCYQYRLEEASRLAKKNDCGFLATTLSISPHKDSEIINKAGVEAAKKFGIVFLEKDFKEKDGFKKSCQLSKKLELYRQNYCGCEFSIRPKRKDYKI